MGGGGVASIVDYSYDTEKQNWACITLSFDIALSLVLKIMLPFAANDFQNRFLRQIHLGGQDRQLELPLRLRGVGQANQVWDWFLQPDAKVELNICWL
jgi:hypothetical protein